MGTKLSQRPADRKHPFGFGRIEYFSAIIIAVIVLSAGITSLIESVKKIFDPTEPEYTTTTLAVIVVAIVVKLLLGQYVKRKGEHLKSDALIASGSDALFDAIITLATLVSAGVMLLWGVSLDGILGALISVVIITAGIEMLASPVNELLGTSIPAELTGEIKNITFGGAIPSLLRPAYMGSTVTDGNSIADKQAEQLQTTIMSENIAGMESYPISLLEKRSVFTLEGR